MDVHNRGPLFRRLHRHCHLEQGKVDQGILRGWRWRQPYCQRHGHRGGLDECSLLHFHGRPHRFQRLRRIRISHGLDRRLCAACTTAGPLPPQVRQVHRAGIHRRTILFQDCPSGGRDMPYSHFRHLRHWPNERCGRGLFALSGNRLQHGPVCWHGHRVLLRRSRRHERHHLHANRSVRGSDFCLHRARHFHFPANYRQPNPPAGPRR